MKDIFTVERKEMSRLSVFVILLTIPFMVVFAKSEAFPSWSKLLVGIVFTFVYLALFDTLINKLNNSLRRKNKVMTEKYKEALAFIVDSGCDIVDEKKGSFFVFDFYIRKNLPGLTTRIRLKYYPETEKYKSPFLGSSQMRIKGAGLESLKILLRM